WRDDALFHPSLKATYAELLGRGWTDAIRARFPDERIYTFWKYWPGAFERNEGLRIDHFLLSPSVKDRLTAAGVDRDHRGGDHAADLRRPVLELHLGDLGDDGTEAFVHRHAAGPAGRRGRARLLHGQVEDGQMPVRLGLRVEGAAVLDRVLSGGLGQLVDG